ncbi:MAG TPA: hypothetical protein VGA30_10415 [Actinomycetota bacterium]
MKILPTSPRERLLVKVMAGVVGLLVVLLAVHAMSGGKAAPASTSAPSGPFQAPKPAPSAPGQTHHGNHVVPEFTGVDPFVPLVTPAPSPVETTDAPPPAQPQTGSTTVVNGKSLQLVGLFMDNGVEKAQVTVDGVTYQAAPGDTFADEFVLVSIADPCANFSWQTSTFTLCLSQTTTTGS